MADRAKLVSNARQTILRGSKSFAAASHLFERTVRERVWLLYAWCRRSDDIIDAQDHGGTLGPQDGAAERLALVRNRTDLAFAGKETGDPAFDALGMVARETGLTPAMANAVIEGFALDASSWQPHTEADLMRYCWHVAGAVGVMMAVVMGVSPDDEDTLDRACDLGLAFQLANIARDIEEDARAGRCYIPRDWLAQAGIAPDALMQPDHRAALVGIVGRMCHAALVHECSARIGAARLPLRQRWAILSAAAIYGEIARKVERGGARAWDRRVYVETTQKLGFIAAAAWSAIRPVPRSCIALASERQFHRARLMTIAAAAPAM